MKMNVQEYVITFKFSNNRFLNISIKGVKEIVVSNGFYICDSNAEEKLMLDRSMRNP